MVTNKKISPYVFPGFKYKAKGASILNPVNQMEVAEYYLNTICSYYGVDVARILKRDRRVEMVRVRNICIYFIRTKTRMSLKRIGEMFMKDHTTIIHALTTVEQQLSSKFENEYKDDVDNIKRLLWVK